MLLGVAPRFEEDGFGGVEGVVDGFGTGCAAAALPRREAGVQVGVAGEEDDDAVGDVLDELQNGLAQVRDLGFPLVSIRKHPLAIG